MRDQGLMVDVDPPRLPINDSNPGDVETTADAPNDDNDGSSSDTGTDVEPSISDGDESEHSDGSAESDLPTHILKVRIQIYASCTIYL